MFLTSIFLLCFQDNDKKNILAVQTIRNTIMGSTLMATAAILLSSLTGAFMTSTYFSTKSPILGGQSDTLVNFKYTCLIFCFLFSFLCYMQSVRYFNHVNYLINIPIVEALAIKISPDYVANVLAKGNNFFTIGTRGFYFAFPLILWLFGPIPVIVSSIALVPAFYYLDAVELDGDDECLRRDAERSWVLDVQPCTPDEEEIGPVPATCQH